MSHLLSGVLDRQDDLQSELDQTRAETANLARVLADACDSLDAVLRHNIRGNDTDGYAIVGVWTKLSSFRTRAEAVAAYLAFAKRVRGEQADSVPPAPATIGLPVEVLPRLQVQKIRAGEGGGQ